MEAAPRRVHEMAWKAQTRLCGRSASVSNAKRFVYLKLMEKHQNSDPFKFIIYSATAKDGEQTPQIAAPK